MQYIINVLMLGGLYGIVASGFSLVYAIMNILNVAHGALVMVGAFLTFTLVSSAGIDPLLTIPITAAALFILGFLIQRYALSLLFGTSIFMTFIFTYGLDMVLINGAILTWGPVYLNMNSPYRGHALRLGEAVLPLGPTLVFLTAAALAGLLFFVLWKTRLGLAIQATALDIESAQLAGVDVKMIFAITLGIASALAGAAGSLLAIVLPIYPLMGVPLISKAFVTSVLGGLGSIPGALVAGVILAALEVGAVSVLSAGYSALVSYAILVLVLVFRPQGLFGREYFSEVNV